MILHCPKCMSKYKIKDDIITEQGINAKCYKCGSIFFVRKREAVELNNIVSSLKENISRWEERAVLEGARGKPAPASSKQGGQGTEIEHKGTGVKEERDEVSELLNEIESDILKGKNLPGEERLKGLLKEETPLFDEISIKEEPSISAEDIISSAEMGLKVQEPVSKDNIDELLNELESSVSSTTPPVQVGEEGGVMETVHVVSQTHEPELASGEGGANLKDELPAEEPASVEAIPLSLNVEVKSEGILSQADLDKLFSEALTSSPEAESINKEEGILTGGTELSSEKSTPSSASAVQMGDEGGIDLDKLLEDTVAELGDKSITNKEVVEPSPERPESVEAGEIRGESAGETTVLSESPETEIHLPETQTTFAQDLKTAEDMYEEKMAPLDIMADMEEEFKSKGAGFPGKIGEKWQYLTFFISSYVSRLSGRILKLSARQGSDLTEDSAEGHPKRIKVTWKLIVLSLIMIVILAGGIGFIVMSGKRWMAGVKEKEEIVVVKERPAAKEPQIEEEKTEEPIKPPKIEKKAEPPPPLQGETQAAAAPAPSPVPEERLARLGVILPVAFSPEETKVMTMNIKLELENKETADMVKGNPFYYEGIIEDFVDQFFRDKFYEDTHFVREKLKEAILRQLNENIKNGRVKKVDLEELKVK